MGQMSRRQLLFTGAAVGGEFLLGTHLEALPRVRAATPKGTQPDFVPNAFIRIGKDGRVTLIMNQVEMGQGTYTSMPMLVAEELEVGLDQVQLEQPDTNSVSIQCGGGHVSWIIPVTFESQRSHNLTVCRN